MERLCLAPDKKFTDSWPGWGPFLGSGRKKIVRQSGRTPSEWVKVAERLSAENHGVLPGVKWLRINGYQGLPLAIKNNPNLFAHIVREKLLRQPSEWVPIAEALAKENGGVLPNPKALTRKGFGGLVQTMRNHRHLFDHIPQAKLVKSISDWLVVAKQLASDNNGLVPCGLWLRKNGFSALSEAAKKHPDVFSDLVFEANIHRIPNDWMEIAKELAIANNGILPSCSWLIKNGYSGLYACMLNHSELFMDISRERRDSQGRIINQGATV